MFFFHKDIPFHGLTQKLEIHVRGKLWLQALIGLVMGVCVGVLLGPDIALVSPERSAIVTTWLALPGEVFLRLIKMVLIPLVTFSIMRGLGGTTDVQQLKNIGLKFVIFVLSTTVLAAAIGMSFAVVLQPGSYVQVSSDGGEIIHAAAPSREIDIIRDLPQHIASLIPINPLASALELELLGLVVFSILIGIALAMQPQKKIEPVLTIIDSVLEVTMTIIKWAMYLAPWAVFGLMTRMAAQVGVVTLLGMGVYVFTVLIGLSVLLLFYYVLVALLSNTHPVQFATQIGGAQLLAFSTSSSAAVMPLSIRTAEEKLNVDSSVSHVVIPLGATINMAGTALYQSVSILFLAQVSGIDLSIAQLITLVVTLVASSIGAPSTPGVGLVILATVATGFGIPVNGLVLIFGIDRILDMCRTTLNVTGDLAACVILDRNAGWKKGAIMPSIRTVLHRSVE